MRNRTAAIVPVLLLSVVAGCGDDASDSDSLDTSATQAADASTTAAEAVEDVGDAEDEFPDILEATATFDETSGTWTFAVTVSSPYDTPERYADGWRVLGPEGTVFGVHTLTHDHASEQPFTRRQSGVMIPDDVTEVTIEGRDLVNGYGGDTRTVPVPR